MKTEQRVIKFRCWDNATKKMYYKAGIMLSENHVTHIDGVVMQFTGLVDKEKVEIFDGDLIRDDSGNIGRVFWGDYGWLVEFEAETTDPDAIERWGRVVGNIYQSTDLLPSTTTI